MYVYTIKTYRFSGFTNNWVTFIIIIIIIIITYIYNYFIIIINIKCIIT